MSFQVWSQTNEYGLILEGEYKTLLTSRKAVQKIRKEYDKQNILAIVYIKEVEQK